MPHDYERDAPGPVPFRCTLSTSLVKHISGNCLPRSDEYAVSCVSPAHTHLQHVLGQGQGRCDAFPHVHDLLPQLGLSGAVICTQGHNDIDLLHGADKWEMREILHPQKKSILCIEMQFCFNKDI